MDGRHGRGRKIALLIDPRHEHAHTRLRFAPWWYEVGWWNLKDFNLTKSDIIPLRYHEGRGVPCLEACRIFIGLRGMPVSIVQCPCPVILCTFKATMPADLLSESKWKSRLMIDSSVGKKGESEQVVASMVPPRPSSLLPFLSCLPVALLFLSSYSHPPRRAVPFLSWDFLPSLSSSSSKNLTSDLTRFGPTVILHRGCLFPFFLFIVGESVRSICGNLDDDEFYNFTMKELNHLNHLNEFIWINWNSSKQKAWNLHHKELSM